MNSKDTLNLLSKDSSLYQPFSQLTRLNQLRVSWQVLRSQAVIIFSQKFAWFIAVVLAYFTFLYVVNYRQPVIDRLTQDDILPSLLTIPLIFLALLLNMLLISSEKDKRTLEVLFTSAGSRYKVWLLRVGTLNLLLLLIAVMLSNLAFFMIADINIIGTALHGFIPALFIGGMTFYFSVKFRSGLAAVTLVLIAILFILMMSDAIDDTRYFLFFNPYDVPRELDPETWNIWMWQNRIAVVSLGILMYFFGLRGLEARERFLR